MIPALPMSRARFDAIRGMSRSLPAPVAIAANHRAELVDLVEALLVQVDAMAKELTLRRYEALDCRSWVHTDDASPGPEEIDRALLDVAAQALYDYDEATGNHANDPTAAETFGETPLWQKKNYRDAVTPVLAALLPATRWKETPDE